VRDYTRSLGVLRSLRTQPALLVAAITDQHESWDFLETAMRALDLPLCPIVIVTNSDTIRVAHERVGAPWSVLLMPVQRCELLAIVHEEVNAPFGESSSA